MFSYACIHCYNLDPAIEAWASRQDSGVEFRRVPAIFSEMWAHFAQAYFTAQVLDVEDQVHTPLFRAIHQQGVDLTTVASMATLFQEVAGVDPEEFKSVFESFAVRGRVQQAQARTRAYRVSGVPTIIVNGKFRLDAQMAGGNPEMLELVDHLIESERSVSAAGS